MADFKNLTISQAFNNINYIYYLPDIQRDYKWDEKRVIDFFDSLMSGYPIGTFLIWKQHKNEYNDSKSDFYKFISEAQAMDNSGEKLIKPVNIDRKNIYAILDGQQRLTSIYLALNGGYRMWKGRGRHPVNERPPLRELYFHPAGRSGKNYTSKNEFRFFIAADREDGWYKVKDIYKATNLDLFFKANGITTKPERTQTQRLFSILHDKEVLPFYEITKEHTADDAVEIFLRLNSGGLPLKRTELLFALAINNWPGGRSELEDFLKGIHELHRTYGNWQDIDKDFLLKTCLYLFEDSISMSVDDLRKVDFASIEKNWDDIKSSVSDVLTMLDNNGHSSSTIISLNAIIPLIYYRYYNPQAFKKDIVKRELNKLFIISQINGLFSSSTDSVLMRMRKSFIWGKNTDFVFSDYASQYDNNADSDLPTLNCDEETVTSWVKGKCAFKKDNKTLLLLSSMPKYIDKGNYYYEQDHLHPSKTFINEQSIENLRQSNISQTDIDEWTITKDTLGNLQLYRDIKNKNKSGTALSQWKATHKSWEFAYDPAEEMKKDPSFTAGDNPYDIKYFGLFIEKRADMIIKELKSLLLT